MMCADVTYCSTHNLFGNFGDTQRVIKKHNIQLVYAAVAMAAAAVAAKTFESIVSISHYLPQIFNTLWPTQTHTHKTFFILSV